MSKNVFLDTSNWIRLPVAQLQEGMFVASLDRPWVETPFLLQGFVIRRQSEIRKLQELCSFVYIEKEGRLWGDKKDPFYQSFGAVKRNPVGGDESGLASRAKRKGEQPSLVSSINKRSQHPTKVSVTEAHEFARETYREAKQQTVDILEQAKLGNALETSTAKQAVKGCVSSLLDNPDALMWMAKIKHADEYTLEHCLNVCILAIAFGRHLRMDEVELEKLGMCGLLHDVGKMQIPDEILNKPGKLTDEESAEMKSHTMRGKDLLMKNKDALIYTIDAAMNHHERIDGKGYPRGLYAAELSEYARMISIVDAFDAMTSERCYSDAKSTLDALKEIFRERGKQFDEELALEFIQLIGPYPPGTIVELKNGCVGIVLSSDIKKRHLPAIKIILDKEKNKQPPELIDLRDVDRQTLPKDCLISRVLKDGDYDIRIEEYKVSPDFAAIGQKERKRVAEDEARKAADEKESD